MGLKSSLNGATFPGQSIISYNVVLSLRMNSKGFFSGDAAPPGSGEPFLRPPLTTIWVGQTRMHWLPYFGGSVTALRLRDAPILTGKMSGCPLSIFTYDGQPHLGHVGTVDDNEDDAVNKNKAVKQAWQSAVASGKIRPVRAWNPAGDVDTTGFVGPTAPQIFGAADQHGKGYSLICTEAQSVYTVARMQNGNAREGVQCVRAVLNAKNKGGD